MPEGSTESLRVQIASDLHLEFYDVLPPFENFLKPVAEVVALLGDISALGHKRGRRHYEEFLGQCCSHFHHVLILVGNHEFYSDELTQATCAEILAYMRSLPAKYPKVRLLENDGLTLQGVRIAGTALWSAIPDEQTIDGAARRGHDRGSTVEFCMNDYRLCYVEQEKGKRCLAVAETNAWHEEAVAHLHAEARRATAEGVNLLVLTHHTPTFQGTSDPRYGNDPSGISTAFSTDLEGMMQDPALASIHTWCFGHTHYNSDQQRHGRRLVSNQLGYPERPSRGYRRDFVVEVPTRYGIPQEVEAPRRGGCCRRSGDRQAEAV